MALACFIDMNANDIHELRGTDFNNLCNVICKTVY